ncbi:MAG: FTR1 family protein, partial [Oscillospiraceae bacterium]|nr:FTR1 family protein [Oscillospiraceae bacterium]
QEVFQIIMLMVAAGLIIQMVLWMKEHSHKMKKELESGMQKSAESAQWWGIFILAAIAVGREGSETVIFLSGTFVGLHGVHDFFMFFLAFAIGFALAMVLFYLLQVGSKFISWRWFFLVTEILLLFLGGALFMTSLEKLFNLLIQYNVPNWFYWFNGKVFDISNILSDTSSVGSLMASILGYRSHPSRIDIIAFVVYWIIVFALLKYIKVRKQKKLAA